MAVELRGCRVRCPSAPAARDLAALLGLVSFIVLVALFPPTMAIPVVILAALQLQFSAQRRAAACAHRFHVFRCFAFTAQLVS